MNPLFQISSRQLRRDTQRASILTLVARSIEYLFQFAGLAILARLLTPSDFGLYAMATPFLMIIKNFSDLGLEAALLQQRDLSEGHASAVFQVNLLAGLALAGLFLVVSPLLGSFYQDHRVTSIAAVLSLTFVISGFTAVQRALLRRALLIDALLRAQIAASAVSTVVAIIFALNGAGYWALIARALADPVTYAIFVWSSSGWVPGRAEWDRTTKFLLRFGTYYIGAGLVWSLGTQADSVLIGWRFGSVELGPYTLASRLFALPVGQISSPLGHVMVPALSRIRDDPERFKRWYLKLLRLITFVAFPLNFSLVFCADDVVRFVAGPQWDKAADILRVLAPVGAVFAAYVTIDWLMRSQGHADRAFRWTIISATAHLASFVLGLTWGAIGVAAGFTAVNLLLFVPAFVYATKGTSIQLMDVLKSMLPSAALMIVTAGAVYALRTFLAEEWHPILRLLATGVVIAATMACGIALVYGRSLLGGRWLTLEAP
jgi:O-antigen/teichoic acid export membrane protein